jgi:hypothetical protein
LTKETHREAFISKKFCHYVLLNKEEREIRGKDGEERQRERKGRGQKREREKKD